MHAPSYDVVTMGRVGVDIYPLQVGVPLDHVDTFGKFLGGSATNVAVATARHGRRSAVITRTGDDPFGRYVHRALRQFDVDDRFVAAVPDLPTPVTFCEIFPPDDFPLYFYRVPKAPDLEIRPDELDLDAIARAAVFWVTVTGLCQEPSRSAHHAALEARGGKSHTVLDLDYRPMFWASREEARREVRRVLPHVTAVIGNLEECETAVGEREPHAAAEALLATGVQLAIVKQGPAGVLGMTREETVTVPPHPVDVVNGLGAGDGFGGAVCHGLLSGWPLERVLRFANVAGALVAARLECSSAMPTTAEVDAAHDDSGVVSVRNPDANHSRVRLHVPAGTLARGGYALDLRAEDAGWSYCSLRVLELAAGESRTLATGDDEVLVLSLGGAAVIEADGERVELNGRPDVFGGISDFVYVPRDTELAISSEAGGRFALPGARADPTVRLPVRHVAASDVAVELRGAGPCSRQVVNLCMPDGPGASDASRIMACEVYTPAGNWSSFPPHKHDQEGEGETELEEIYYFEVAAGPTAPGMAYQRVYGTAGRPIDVLAEIRTGDVVLVPHGWHGPSMATPGYDLYYLNVMAGPGAERAWRICFDADHRWVAETWPGVPVDPRLPLTTAAPAER